MRPGRRGSSAPRVFNASVRREYERELLLARKQAERATERVARLFSVTSALAEALTPVQVAEIITQQGVAALSAQAGFVGILTEDGVRLTITHAVGYPPGVLASWQEVSLASATPLADAVRTGEPILIGSPDALATRYPQLASIPDRTGSRSVAAIPLNLHGRALGVLGLSFTTEQVFTAEDRAFLLTLAHQCALALERARLL